MKPGSTTLFSTLSALSVACVTGVTVTTPKSGPLHLTLARLLVAPVAAQPVENVVGVLRRDPDHRPDRVGQRHPRHVERHGGRIHPGLQLPVELGAQI